MASRRLVTALESLSPANKWGDGARDYMECRNDLLRGGTRIRLLGEPPPAPYYVYLSRWQRRPYTQIWPIALRERLPTLPVPLLQDDPDADLDLGATVAACFELVGYERLLPYGDPAPPPELTSEDAAWVEETLVKVGLRDKPRRARPGTDRTINPLVRSRVGIAAQRQP